MFCFSFIFVVAMTKIKQQCGIRQSLKIFLLHCVATTEIKVKQACAADRPTVCGPQM